MEKTSETHYRDLILAYKVADSNHELSIVANVV